MTDRATFGDFALAARRHLDVAAQRSSTTAWPRPGVFVAELHEFSHELRRVLRVMGRYLADITEACDAEHRDQSQPLSPWTRAAIEARAAVQNAYLSLPLAEHNKALQPQAQMTGSATRELHAAVVAMTAGRDLLHTHFASVPEGGRQFRSEWASVITSESGRRAMLLELVGWARQILVKATDLSASRVLRSEETAAEERKVLAACRWLSAMIEAFETAHALNPVTSDEVSQLRAIPASVLRPRRQPVRTATVKDLCRGTGDCAERVRRAATADLPDPALASWITAESFHQAAEPENISEVLAAVHQATTTLTTIAAADYDQIRTAGLAGRLLVPLVKPGHPSQADQPFARAPKQHFHALLDAYRDAGTASAKATAKIAEVAAAAKVLGRSKQRSRAATLASRKGVGGSKPDASPVSGGSKETKQEMAGPVERILREFGVTDLTLLNRGQALDEATSQLVAEAAQVTAPQRWNVAVKHLSRSHDTGQIIGHVMAQNDAPLMTRRLSSRVAGHQMQPQHGPEAEA